MPAMVKHTYLITVSKNETAVWSRSLRRVTARTARPMMRHATLPTTRMRTATTRSGDQLVREVVTDPRRRKQGLESLENHTHDGLRPG
jgi:hypothetical protein